MAVSVRDAEDRVIDTEVRSVTVPPADASGLSWSTPVLLRARTPIEIRTLLAEADPAPFAGNDLARGRPAARSRRALRHRRGRDRHQPPRQPRRPRPRGAANRAGRRPPRHLPGRFAAVLRRRRRLRDRADRQARFGDGRDVCQCSGQGLTLYDSVRQVRRFGGSTGSRSEGVARVRTKVLVRRFDGLTTGSCAAIASAATC